MVPTKEFAQLAQYYKGEITDNALLNKVGRLAAESHVILRDKSIPDSIAIKKIKPLARQRGRLTKRIRQIGPLSSSSGDVSREEHEEEGDLVKGPLETIFKQLIKSTSRGGNEKVHIKKEKTPDRPSTSAVKTKPPPSKIPIAVLHLSEETSGKRKGKRKRKNETERLKPTSGWEDWAKGQETEKKSPTRLWHGLRPVSASTVNEGVASTFKNG